MNRTELQIKRKTMRKLKLYGKKEEGDIVLVATVYFDEKKELTVSSKYPEVKRDLTKEIEWLDFAMGWGDLDILRHILNKVRISVLGDFRISERKITGEKLEFFGRKLSDRQHIATVYVDENKKVIVEAEDPKVKEDLLNAIYDPDAPDEPPTFILKGPAPTEELRKKEREEGKESLWATGVKPGDPEFLEGLYYGIRAGSRRKFGDYYVYWHDIVEE